MLTWHQRRVAARSRSCFAARRGCRCPSRIYALEHAGLGQFDLFLVPIAADRDGVRYEAIFT